MQQMILHQMKDWMYSEKKTGISSVQLDLVHGQSNPPQAAEMIKYIMTYKKES